MSWWWSLTSLGDLTLQSNHTLKYLRTFPSPSGPRPSSHFGKFFGLNSWPQPTVYHSLNPGVCRSNDQQRSSIFQIFTYLTELAYAQLLKSKSHLGQWSLLPGNKHRIAASAIVTSILKGIYTASLSLFSILKLRRKRWRVKARKYCLV